MGQLGHWSPFFVVVTESGKYYFFKYIFFLAPLFTKLHKDELLDNFQRGRIYGYIEENPGTHYNEIKKKLEVKNGTLSHHLHILEKMGMIKSRKEGIRYRAFYSTGVKFPEEEKFRLTDLQIHIINLIKANPGITQKIIAQNTNLKKQTINYNVKMLEKIGKIKIVKRGRNTNCYPAENN